MHFEKISGLLVIFPRYPDFASKRHRCFFTFKPSKLLCCVRGCQSRYFPNSRISRHRIPKDVSTRSKWLKAIGFGESKVNDASRISNSQGNTPKLMKFRLKQNAVPSIFPKKNVCGVHTFPTQRILSIDDVILCLNETHLPSGVMSYFDFEKEQWLFMGMDYVNGGSPHVMFSVVSGSRIENKCMETRYSGLKSDF
ncbi:THAP1_3 [Lepeophtheirus salmonis]|uniref:THAP1_3 n=1 Tax=Lepeophtheirus salmonis TaxID=72036 RepID=A0A7R8CQ91_LEPSM|nr:THAP1_3 [Lepeophtheirus salmonis]CAF2890799.1 THAP1_3 [Lepeophtheirus salmonis]